jgi:hypothetical protein
MPSRSLDGVLRMEPSIGSVLTHGMKIGVTMVSSRSYVVQTIVELKDKWLQEKYLFENNINIIQN